MYFKKFSIDNALIFEKEDDLISYFENNIKENQLYDNCKGYISLKLTNAIIKCNFNLRNINLYFNKNKDEFYFNFNFNNIIFEGEFNCYISKHSNIKFHFCYLSFNDVVFEKNVYFSRLKFIGKDNEGNINFYNVNFKSDLYFSKTKFYNSDINFLNICCDSLVEFSFSKFYVKDKLITKYNINFQCIDFYKTLSFEGSMLYNISLNFNDINFYSNVNFNFLKIIFNTKIKLAIYERVGLNINNSYFDYNKSIKFTNMISNCYINFISNELNSSIDFSNSKFYNNFLFNSNFIYEKIIFSNVEIFKKAYLLKTKEIKKTNHFELYENKPMILKDIIKNEKLKIIFDNLVFKDNDSTLYIDNGNYKKSFKVSFQNINIKGKIELRNMEIEEADFKGSIIDGGLINPVNFKVNKFANRESALFLKQQAYARNNIIDALQYQAQEVELHKEELKEQFKKNKNLKTFGDILSIELSSLYSNNGQNWIRALVITLLTNLTFFGFYFSLINTTWHFILSIFLILLLSIKFIKKEIQIYAYLLILIISGIVFGEIPLKMVYDLFMGQDLTSNFLYRFFIFLNPTNYDGLSILSGQNYIKQFFAGISYFIGKIAFWYGSVQTVTAFRKFSKGG